MPADLELLFKQQVEELEAEKQMRYVTSVERIARKEGHDEGRDEGRKEGQKEGRKEGFIRLLLRLLRHRFGEIPKKVEERLQQLSFAQLETLLDSAMTVAALQDFVTGLPEATSDPTANDG